MQSLNPLDQLTVDAFATALETCREAGVELPEDVWAIAQSPAQHVASLSDIAAQHPQLNAAYRTARKLLRQAEGDRHKRMSTSGQGVIAPFQPFSEQAISWETEDTLTSDTNSNPKTSNPAETLGLPIASDPAASPQPIQPIVYRYTLPDTASPQAAIAFVKQVEAIRQSNPDWIVTFDRPNPGEADAIVLIHNDEHYAATHAAYLTNRTLDQVVGPALNRIFGNGASIPRSL